MKLNINLIKYYKKELVYQVKINILFLNLCKNKNFCLIIIKKNKNSKR